MSQSHTTLKKVMIANNICVRALLLSPIPLMKNSCVNNDSLDFDKVIEHLVFI